MGRGRPVHSCDACHARKIACDSAHPRCNWCFNQDLPCTFFRFRQPVDNTSSKYGTSPLHDGNEPSAPASFSLLNSSATPATPAAREAIRALPPVNDRRAEIFAPAFARQLQIAGRHLGNICTFDGTPILSAGGRDWIEACTGEELQVDPYPIDDAPRWLDPTDLDSPSLPDLASLREQIEQYCSSEFGLFFPVIDPSLFEYTIGAAYFEKCSVVSPAMNSARACIFAFLALKMVVGGPRQNVSLRHSIEFAHEVRRLLPEVLTEPTTLDSLQTLLLLCLCSQGLGADYFAIDQLLSASSRCIYHLRSNLATHVAWESPSALHYHARKLFWIVYVCDKGFSLVTGLAPRLQDTLCDLGLAPVSEHLEQPDGSLHIDGNPYPGSYLFIYAHLAQIQSSIYHELYAPGVMQRSDADIIRNIRYLDHALEQWKDSIPVEIRPTFVPVSGLMRQVLDIRFSIFHLQYHHCMLLIHQSSSRCTSWEGNQNTQNNSSSLAISVSACRSLLRTFLIYRLELGPPNLLFCLSYFIQAVINLFCKVLSNPLGDGNQEDLHLMDEISQLIAESHGRDDPPGYLTKTKFAEEFILELKRLSQCAIDKAIRDKLA